jgi:hypothetical protein
MRKYEGLKQYLAHQKAQTIAMRFADIERLIEDKLPASARKHRAWWSNNPSNSVITHAWLEAGFHTERVDMAAQRLHFRRVKRDGGTATRSATKAEISDQSPDNLVDVDLSKLSDKARSWFLGQANENKGLQDVVLEALEQYAARTVRLAILEKYSKAGLGQGSDSLTLIQEARNER